MKKIFDPIELKNLSVKYNYYKSSYKHWRLHIGLSPSHQFLIKSQLSHTLYLISLQEMPLITFYINSILSKCGCDSTMMNRAGYVLSTIGACHSCNVVILL